MAGKRYVTFEDAAKDLAVLPYKEADKDAARVGIGCLQASDGSISSWDIVRRDGGYVIEVCLVPGEDDGKGGQGEVNENLCRPVLLAPLIKLSPGISKIVGQDYAPTTYPTVEEAYAAFLEVVYAVDENEPELVHVKLANETTASVFDYEVSRAVLSLLERTGEGELGAAMPPIDSDSGADESALYAEALVDFALGSGLPASAVTVKPIDVPTFWFCSGWASRSAFQRTMIPGDTGDAASEPLEGQSPPAFPKLIEYEAQLFSTSDARGEWDFCQIITDGLLPTGVEVWRFGLCRCRGKVYVSVAAVADGVEDISPERAWFGSYAISDGQMRLLGVCWGEDGLVAFDGGHKIEWNPDIGEIESALRNAFCSGA